MLWFIMMGCEGQKVQETGNTPMGCFGTEPEQRILVHGVPSAESGGQTSEWHAHFTDDHVVNFEMGRATMGTVQLSSDGTWGAVAQENGSIGIFRTNNTAVDVLDPEWFPTFGDSTLYATHIWLDPRQDRLWIVDGNLSEKGGLYVAPIDCNTLMLNDVEQVFSAREGGPISAIDDEDFNTVFVAKSINDGPQVLLFDRYDLRKSMDGYTAFPDNEGVYSTLGSNGTDLLIADNNDFSTVGNRVVHLRVATGEVLNTLTIEDPQAIIVQQDFAVIASDSGNGIYLYDLQSAALTEISTDHLMQRPFALLEHNSALYSGENNGIRKITISEDGVVNENMLLIESANSRSIGPFGIVGEW